MANPTASHSLARLTEDRREAIAESCGILNDAELPNVHALARELKAMITLARALDPFAPTAHASLILSRIEPFLPASI